MFSKHVQWFLWRTSLISQWSFLGMVIKNNKTSKVQKTAFHRLSPLFVFLFVFYFIFYVFVCRVTGSWRRRLPCCAEAAAAFDEAPWSRGHLGLRVEAQGGRVGSRWADPPAGLSLLPGWWDPACRSWYRGGGGAGEAGEGPDRSAHPSHQSRNRTQPIASETDWWEKVIAIAVVQFCRSAVGKWEQMVCLLLPQFLE